MTGGANTTMLKEVTMRGIDDVKLETRMVGAAEPSASVEGFRMYQPEGMDPLTS